MKKTLLTILLAAASYVCTAQTNADVYSYLDSVTNVFYGTNSTDASRDTFVATWQKLNHNDIWAAGVLRRHETNLAFLNTNSSGGTVPTNIVLSSKQIITYTTNFASWSGSNFLARVNGLYSWFYYFGDDGGNPPMAIPASLVGSYTGTNGWFVITNGFSTTNLISVSIITNGATARGGTMVNPGGARLYSIDHFELLGKTNYYFGQHQRFDPPTDGNDAATKTYADALFANAFNNNFSTVISSNTTHLIYSFQNSTIFDMSSVMTWIQITNAGVDATGTNFAIGILQTNLSGGYVLQTSTNLALVAGWVPQTNGFTLSTNTGVVTFTIPINFAEDMRFWRVIKGSSSTAAFNVPRTLNGGTIYPSNAWNLASITNAMPNFSTWVGSSNGQAQVTLSLSNGVVRYLQSLR